MKSPKNCAEGLCAVCFGPTVAAQSHRKARTLGAFRGGVPVARRGGRAPSGASRPRNSGYPKSILAAEIQHIFVIFALVWLFLARFDHFFGFLRRFCVECASSGPKRCQFGRKRCFARIDFGYPGVPPQRRQAGKQGSVRRRRHDGRRCADTER